MNKLAQIDFDNLQKVASPRLDTGSTLAHLINNPNGPDVIDLAFFFAGSLALIYLIYGGITYSLSKGDPKAVAAAQARLTYAIAGLIIVFSAFWILQITGMFFGFTAFGF